MPSKAKPIQMTTTYAVGGAVPRPSNPQSAEIMANKQQSKRGSMTPGRTGGQTLRTQGPKRRSLRDIATRRKGMQARAALQKAMLAGRTEDMKALAKKQKDKIASLGRTKQTRPTSPPPRPSGSGQKLRPSRGNSGISQFNAAQSNALEQFNRTRTKKTRPTSTPPVRGRNNNRRPSMFNRSRTRSQNRR